jgi:hypothetical protein
MASAIAMVPSFNGFPPFVAAAAQGIMPRVRETNRIVRKMGGVVLVAALLGASAARAFEMEFAALSPADQWDTRTYRAIWDEFGDRIVTAFETVTCMPFVEPRVAAVVANDVSHSGGPEHPMQLRATYARAVKQATLVHELGHRHLWQLVERLDGVDGHQTLYLVLDRIWAQVWGEDFAARQIATESAWLASYDYGEAWRWAQSLSRAERALLWNELLARNGFRSGCNAPADAS